MELRGQDGRDQRRGWGDFGGEVVAEEEPTAKDDAGVGIARPG